MTALAVLWLAERGVEQLKLAAAGLCFCSAALLFVVGDLERAILLSSILAAGIFGASKVKYVHSGIKLVATDLPLVFAGTVPFLLAQYPLALTAVLAGSMPDDYGKVKVAGEIVALSSQHIAIRRHDSGAGEVVVHFPRAGFLVLPA